MVSAKWPIPGPSSPVGTMAESSGEINTDRVGGGADLLSEDDTLQPIVDLRMLGGFSISVDGQPVEALKGRTATSLLAYLACHRDRPHTRELLIGAFWPSLEESKARKRLSNALWQISSACEKSGVESILERGKERVSLRSDFRFVCDHENFDAKLNAFDDAHLGQPVSLADPSAGSELAEIVADYRGEFLAGYYDDWMDFERTRLAERYVEALAQLVRQFKNLAEYEAAVRHARQLLAADPLREESHRELMRLYALLGQVSAAKRQYDDCREMLADQLSVEPSEETADLLRRIEREAAAGVGSATPQGAAESLVGRSETLAELLARTEEAIAGRGGVVLLEGDLGLGKSRLVAELSGGARWRGATVLLASHDERSHWSPYGGLCEALGPACAGLRGEHVAEFLDPLWATQIRKFLPQFGGVPSVTADDFSLTREEEHLRTVEAFARLILALGRVGPTVLILEDLQWADEELVSALTFLGRELAGSDVLLCLTYRLSEAQQVAPLWSALGELSTLECVSRFQLEPLSGSDMRRLLMAQPGAGLLSSSLVDKLVDVVDGVPMLAIQLMQQPDLVDGESLLEDQIDLLASDVMVEAVSRRMGAAGGEVREVLELLAVLDEPAGSKVVSRLLDVPRSVAIASLSGAVEARFLVESVDGCLFVSKEIRRLVYGQLSTECRTRLHGRVLDYLLDVGDESGEVLGHHAWHAKRWDLAWRYHRDAAVANAEVYAFQTACDHFESADRAADELAMPMTDWFDDLMMYEGALDVLARRDTQRKLLDRLETLDLTQEMQQEVTLRRVGWLAHLSPQESIELAQSAIEEAERAGLPCGEIRACLGMSQFDRGSAADAIETLAAAIPELDEHSSIADEATLWLAKAHIDKQNFDQARGIFKEVARQAWFKENLRYRIEVVINEASIWAYEGDLSKAEALHEESLELSRRIGYRRGEGVSLFNLGLWYGLRGQAGPALKTLHAAGEILALISETRGRAFVDTNLADIYHRLLGDDETAQKLATRSAVFSRSIGDVFQEALCLDTQARIELRAGRKRKAKSLLTELLQRPDLAEEAMTQAQLRLALCEVHLALAEFAEAASLAALVLAQSEEKSLSVLDLEATIISARALASLDEKSQAVALARNVTRNNSVDQPRGHLVAWRAAEVFAVTGHPEPEAEQVRLAYEWLVAGLSDLTTIQRERSWRNVPEHRAILYAYRQQVPISKRYRWPAAGQGTEMLTEVDIVVSEPQDWLIADDSERRQRQLARIWRQAGDMGVTPRIADLAECVEVSERTVQRDLSLLRRLGKLK